MRLFSVFKTFDGEANTFHGIGQPSVFIRFAGCNLSCAYCDKPYACQLKQGREVSVERIMWEVEKYACQKVTITGGEPLVQPKDEFESLLQALVDSGKICTIETNGSLPLDFFRHGGEVRCVVDYKLPSSGQEHKMRTQLFKIREGFADFDCVKFVISDKVDFDRAVEIVRLNYGVGLSGDRFVFSPVVGRVEVKTLADWLLRLGEECLWAADLSLSFQAHKIFKWKEQR